MEVEENSVSTSDLIHPFEVVDYRRRGITDLSRGPRIIAVPVSSTSHITLNLVDRVSADEPPITHHRLGGSITPITRSDSCFVGGWDVGYVNEGIHAIEEEQPGVLSTVFSDHEPESEATSDGLAERPMKDAEDGGVGYVLEPPPGIDAGGVIGDPAAVNMSGSVKVRNGEVIVGARGEDPKCSKMCGHERDMHRRAMAMEAELHDGDCSGIARQFHNIDMLKGKLAGVEVS